MIYINGRARASSRLLFTSAKIPLFSHPSNKIHHLSPQVVATTHKYRDRFKEHPQNLSQITKKVIHQGLNAIQFAESMLCLLAAYGNDFFRFVIVEPTITAHLDVNKYIRLHQLGHEDRILANHQRTDP